MDIISLFIYLRRIAWSHLKPFFFLKLVFYTERKKIVCLSNLSKFKMFLFPVEPDLWQGLCWRQCPGGLLSWNARRLSRVRSNFGFLWASVLYIYMCCIIGMIPFFYQLPHPWWSCAHLVSLIFISQADKLWPYAWKGLGSRFLVELTDTAIWSHQASLPTEVYHLWPNC